MLRINRFFIFVLLTGICSISISFSYAAQNKSKISMERAKEIALKKIPGVVKSSEFEHEMGQDVYSFDIIGTDKQIHEILVNAHSGKIVSNKIESAEQEAIEAKEEKK